MEQGKIVTWEKKVEDQLSEGDLLCKIEPGDTETPVGLESPKDGYLAKILIDAGTKDIPIGKPLCIIVAEKEDIAKFESYQPLAEVESPIEVSGLLLGIGTKVSANYEGRWHKAKVKSVDKQIKVRVTLKDPNGSGTMGQSLTICDHDIISTISDAPLQTNVVVKMKHPDNNEQVVEANVVQIHDQSKYTVIFNDGNIATLKRNALSLKKNLKKRSEAPPQVAVTPVAPSVHQRLGHVPKTKKHKREERKERQSGAGLSSALKVFENNVFPNAKFYLGFGGGHDGGHRGRGGGHRGRGGGHRGGRGGRRFRPY